MLRIVAFTFKCLIKVLERVNKITKNNEYLVKLSNNVNTRY